MSVQRPPAWARTGPLPSLSNLKSISGDANQSLTHVSERGGPWDSAVLDPTFHPSLQTTLPMTIVYSKDPQLGWLPYLLIAESTLLRRAGAPRGLGVFALKRFRGPREAGANDGDEIGFYGGDVVASAPTQLEAKERAQTLVRRGHQSLLTMRMRGRSGWLVVDGNQHSVLPFLNRVNDPRNTPFAPRCTVSDFGIFRAARDIPPLDWTRPLSEQAASELSIDYGKEYWETHDLLGSKALPLEVGGIRTMNSLFANLGLSVDTRRSQTRAEAAATPPSHPNLALVEADGEGRVVYVDLEQRGDDLPLQALRARLLAVRPTTRALERTPLINCNRALVEIKDRVALDLFQSWLITTAINGAVGEALRQLLRPLGSRILLLGAHFICPRITEYEPRVLPQQPHTDVGTRGEVIAIGLNLQGEPMNTLIDTHATLDTNGNVQGGSGFHRAHTSVFAFETAAVHAGPGISHVQGPYPRFLTSRIFFLLSSADLDPAMVAKHRADNGLVGSENLVFELPFPTP